MTVAAVTAAMRAAVVRRSGIMTLRSRAGGGQRVGMRGCRTRRKRPETNQDNDQQQEFCKIVHRKDSLAIARTCSHIETYRVKFSEKK